MVERTNMQNRSCGVDGSMKPKVVRHGDRVRKHENSLSLATYSVDNTMLEVLPILGWRTSARGLSM